MGPPSVISWMLAGIISIPIAAGMGIAGYAQVKSDETRSLERLTKQIISKSRRDNDIWSREEQQGFLDKVRIGYEIKQDEQIRLSQVVNSAPGDYYLEISSSEGNRVLGRLSENKLEDYINKNK